MVVVSSRRRPSLGRPPPIALAALGGVVAAVVLFVVLTSGPPAEQQRADRFAQAWATGDYAAMHAELTPSARTARPLAAFRDDYRRAAAVATATAVRPGKAGKPEDGIVSVPMTVVTRAFGRVRTTLLLPFAGEGDEARIAWSQNLTFPGVQRGQRLERSMRLPRRADILARDGTPLAAGEDRGSPLGDVATAISGRLGPAEGEDVARLRRLGVPDDAQVGLTGLERVFQDDVAGRPGGTLRAGGAVLARSTPRAASAVRTSIDPKIQRAAVEGLGALYGGVAVVRPRTGEILGLAGVAFSSLQPPGSTFKIVTLAGALENRLAGPRSTYPVVTQAELEGVEIENANGESCGGTLREAFAHSCNSVFAPLGARLGPDRLVKIAEAFGFNQDLGIPGAATSLIPRADEIGDALAVGSSAIGQGRVQATALQMAWVASTIADGGRRVPLTLRAGAKPVAKRVLRAGTARIVRAYMESVVRFGTGGAAAIPGVRVAGKTGTAELKTTATPDCTPAPEVECPEPEPEDPTDTDAWFAAFAPANRPRIAVGVLLIANGAGGDTAAPLARQVLTASLKATG
jgi:cell division protein FtsI/penicillin-binding protein 2